MSDDLVEPQQVEIIYETDEPILYEVVDGIAWITMNRPQFNNAQNGQMTYALDDAFNRATIDDAVRCIVLAGNGKHFSAGHDIGTPGRDLHHEFDKRLMLAPHTNKPAAELLYTREQEQYLGMCRRWRDIGGKIWVDPQCKLMHLGQHNFRGDLAESLRVQGRW